MLPTQGLRQIGALINRFTQLRHQKVGINPIITRRCPRRRRRRHRLNSFKEGMGKYSLYCRPFFSTMDASAVIIGSCVKLPSWVHKH